jgi:hypothetical protein
MKEFEFKPALIHLILGYGNARFDQGRYLERNDVLGYTRAKDEAATLLEEIESRLQQFKDVNNA